MQKKNKIFHLFLGHHFDDNIETFLLRKIAGSNFEGLNCMQHVSIYKNIQIIRPFLSFSKKEILNFNKRFNLKYINDPSNYNIKYSRSIVRKYLYDNKNILNKIIKDFNLIRNNYFQYKKMIFQILNLVILEIKLKKIVLDIKKLLRLENELQIKLIDVAFKFLNKNKFNIRYKKIEDIIETIKSYADRVDVIRFEESHDYFEISVYVEVTSFSFVNSAKSKISSSLKSRMATTFTLMDEIPD